VTAALVLAAPAMIDAIEVGQPAPEGVPGTLTGRVTLVEREVVKGVEVLRGP
jgi:hypothetical protein